MEADLNQNLRVDSGQPLAFHQLIQVGKNTGTGISVITTWWWMASASRPLPARSPPFMPRGKRANPRLIPVYALCRGGGRVSALSRQRGVCSATALLGSSAAASFSGLASSAPLPGAPPQPIFCA
jgi:hypothetical protein